MSEKRSLFSPATGVILSPWPYTSKLSLAFKLKKFSFGVPNIFIFTYLYFLCNDAPNLLILGEYRVELPDGRTQIVTYHADHEGGFVADVKWVSNNNFVRI